MSELFREIEEDIRRERVEKLWHRFGKIMVYASLGVIAATIAIVMVQNHRQSVAMEKTSQMLKGSDLLRAEDYKGAIAEFSALAEDSDSPYYGLAMLRKAQAQSAAGQPDEAKKTYEALSRHDSPFASLAGILAYGGADSAQVIAAPERKAPFYYTRSEFRGWQLLAKDKRTEAADQFAMLAQDFEAPTSLRERMQEVLQHIAPEKLAEKLAEKPEAPQPAATKHEVTHDE